MARIFKIVVLLLALLPGAAICEEVLRLQSKADELYHDGHWERAYFIYVNDLAAIGDKYSQYMAGYMCLNGQGTTRDPVQASAWYRLAAERGAPEFIDVRDKLLQSMTDSDLELSDDLYVQLRRSYSDLALALAYVGAERRQLRSGGTGSLLTGSGTGPMTVLDPRSGAPVSREVYVSRAEKRMQLRLDFITATIGLKPVSAEMSDREFDKLADRVAEYLGKIQDR